MASVNVQLYDPNPDGMDITTNFRLATSFYNSRNTHKHMCKYDHNRDHQYDRNAGAAQLYKKNSEGKYVPYDIPGKENQEYHFVAFGNKYFKEITKVKHGTPKSSYAHTERLLMRDILDDLISADRAKDSSDIPEVQRPSDIYDPTSSNYSIMRSYDILKHLADDPGPYKKYLEAKELIVKMWSERPPCKVKPGENPPEGGTCDNFIRNIFPKGSQLGFIVRDYEPGIDNEYGAPKVSKAFKDFEVVYKACSGKAEK